MAKLGNARAYDKMNDKSICNFHWSIELGNDEWFYVGVTTTIENFSNYITRHDHKAIFLDTRDGVILKKNRVLTKIDVLKNTSIVHFRFEPKSKKFYISTVRYAIIQMNLIVILRMALLSMLKSKKE